MVKPNKRMISFLHTMILKNQTIFLAILTSALLISCATPYYERISTKTPTHPPVKKKEGAKNPDQPTAHETTLSTDTKLNYYRSWVELNQPLAEDDLPLLKNLSESARPESIDEALVVLGILKLVHQNTNSSIVRKEEDLNTSANVTTPSPTPQYQLSLEALCDEYKVNLHQALAKNPFLQIHRVFALTAEALKTTKNSPAFNQSIAVTISQKANNWKSLVIVDVSSPDQISDKATTGTLQDNSEASLEELSEGDHLLFQAEQLASNRRYAEAIKTIKRLAQTNHLLNKQAHEKIVDYSNAAVQELRLQAAQAFQNALPVEDPKARANYLLEAKRYLEEALTNYPEAPEQQLNTVRENLAVISKSLDELPEEQAP